MKWGLVKPDSRRCPMRQTCRYPYSIYVTRESQVGSDSGPSAVRDPDLSVTPDPASKLSDVLQP